MSGDEVANMRRARWIQNIEKSLQFIDKLSDDEVRAIVDDISANFETDDDDRLVPFFRAIEDELKMRPSMHGDPRTIFGKALYQTNSKSVVEDDHLLHLGMPRAAMQYVDAVLSGRKSLHEGEGFEDGPQVIHASSEADRSAAKESIIPTNFLAGTICSLADAASGISRTAKRDSAIVQKLTMHETRTLLKTESKLAVQSNRKKLYDNSPDGLWQTNFMILQQRIGCYSSDLSVAESDVQRLKRELAVAEEKKKLLSTQLGVYREISKTASLKRHLFSISTDLRIYVLEQKKRRTSSHLQLLSRYRQFQGAVEEKICGEDFKAELPELFTKIMDELASSKGHWLQGNDATVSQGVRAALEVLRLWRQLAGDRCGDVLLKKINEHERSLNNLCAFKDVSPGVDRKGEYENCTVFLYFNHIFHDTPNGHMESKRRMDTVVERIIKREQIEKRSQVFKKLIRPNKSFVSEASLVSSANTAVAVFNQIESKSIKSRLGDENVSDCDCNIHDVSSVVDTAAGLGCNMDWVNESTSGDFPTVFTNLIMPDASAVGDIIECEKKSIEAPSVNYHSQNSIENARQLSIVQCGETVSPPSWVLPLVHSPSYLARLRDISDDAKKGDWLVALEFDSDEYELDSINSESDIDDSTESYIKKEIEKFAGQELGPALSTGEELGSPTRFFKEALGLDRKGKAIMTMMEAYYPVDAPTVDMKKPNRSTAPSARHFAKEGNNKFNHQRLPRPNIDLEFVDVEGLPPKRKRQPKHDSTYYHSPIRKKPKSEMEEISNSPVLERNLKESSKALQPKSLSQTDTNDPEHKREVETVAILHRLLHMGISKQLICGVVKVNIPVFLNWLNHKTQDINPTTINRLFCSANTWLSVLSAEDLSCLQDPKTIVLPESIRMKLFPTPKSVPSPSIVTCHKYDKLSFLDKNSLTLRAAKMAMSRESAIYSADVTFCHLAQSLLSRNGLDPPSLLPIYEAVRKEMRWNPVDAIEMFQNWIAGEITEPHRKKISVVVAAWLLSRRKDLKDSEQIYFDRKMQSLAEPTSFYHDAHDLLQNIRHIALKDLVVRHEQSVIGDSCETTTNFSTVPVAREVNDSKTYAHSHLAVLAKDVAGNQDEDAAVVSNSIPHDRSCIQADIVAVPIPSLLSVENHGSAVVKNADINTGEVQISPDVNLSHHLFLQAKEKAELEAYFDTNTSENAAELIALQRTESYSTRTTHKTSSASFETVKIVDDISPNAENISGFTAIPSVVMQQPPMIKAEQMNGQAAGSAQSVGEVESTPFIPANPLKIYKADRMRMDDNYGTCEYCHKTGKLLCCDSCCCSYHIKCLSPKLSEIPSGDWYCRRCLESGADKQNVIREADKNSSLCNKWILLWNESTHRWTPSFVLEFCEEKCAFLFEYWIDRKLKRMKKQKWINILETRVLYAATSEAHMDFLEAERISGAKAKKSMKISTDERAAASKQEAMIDTYIGADSVDAAHCAAAIACQAVDVVMNNSNTNAFCCIRPPGHHAGRYGFTQGCMSTGFCLLNNAAIAMVYARVKWGLERVAVIDIDVHHGNGTAEILKGDPRAFFACTHMIHGVENTGFANVAKSTPRYSEGFYPQRIGATDITDNFMSIGIYPMRYASRSSQDINNLAGPQGFRYALESIIIPRLKTFDPHLLIISAGFDAYELDPVGGDMGLKVEDFAWATAVLRKAVEDPLSSGKGRIVSLMEGGYDTNSDSLGLAVCVDNHVAALQI